MIQVEVVTHFNEDAFSQGLVQGLADRIRATLTDVRCPQHGEEPSIRLSTEGIAQTVNEITVDVSACCPAAVARLSGLLEEIRGETGAS